jgi:hypothetical protein
MYIYSTGENDGSKSEHMEQGDSNVKRGELMTPKKRLERESEDRELMIDESMKVSPEVIVGFNNESLQELNPKKIAKTGKLYACMYCSYR